MLHGTLELPVSVVGIAEHRTLRGREGAPRYLGRNSVMALDELGFDRSDPPLPSSSSSSSSSSSVDAGIACGMMVWICLVEPAAGGRLLRFL